MKHCKSMREAEEVFKALSAPMRLRIMELLYGEGDLKLDDLARELKITNSAVSMHVERLVSAGLVKVSAMPGARGVCKVCKPCFDGMMVDMRPSGKQKNFYMDDIPVGAYHECLVTPTCGIATCKQIIGEFDMPKYFMFPNHYDAGVFWFGTGYVLYHLPNRLKPGEKLVKLTLSLELSSEYPGYNEDFPSDIYFEVAGVSLGKWISPGDYGSRRGHYTPSWWPVVCNQYGLLKTLSVTEEGTFIDGGYRIGDVTINDLKIDYSTEITFKISVPKDTKNCGGLTVFGKGFGDYDQGIVCTEYYEV